MLNQIKRRHKMEQLLLQAKAELAAAQARVDYLEGNTLSVKEEKPVAPKKSKKPAASAKAKTPDEVIKFLNKECPNGDTNGFENTPYTVFNLLDEDSRNYYLSNLDVEDFIKNVNMEDAITSGFDASWLIAVNAEPTGGTKVSFDKNPKFLPAVVKAGVPEEVIDLITNHAKDAKSAGVDLRTLAQGLK